MKKLLIIFGAIALAVVLALGVLIGYGIYTEGGLNASGKAYIEANVPPIVKGWSEQELVKRAAPGLLNTVRTEPVKARKMWTHLSNLGPMQSFGKVKGMVHVNFDAQRGKLITANYVADAVFAKGKATLTIRLVQVGGQWKILAFNVNSPALLP